MLKRQVRTLVGVRLAGDTLHPKTDLATATLVLPLFRPARRAANLQIMLKAGVSNDRPFSRPISNELLKRTTLSAEMVTVAVSRGDTEIRIQSEVIRKGLESAIAGV